MLLLSCSISTYFFTFMKSFFSLNGGFGLNKYEADDDDIQEVKPNGGGQMMDKVDRACAMREQIMAKVGGF